ncbi:hypothetical protein ACIBI9_19135 [Nonomuraea sp. NPDC050451]
MPQTHWGHGKRRLASTWAADHRHAARIAGTPPDRRRSPGGHARGWART